MDKMVKDGGMVVSIGSSFAISSSVNTNWQKNNGRYTVNQIDHRLQLGNTLDIQFT
jgi:hypothetical protein